jgi:outer membrane lipase/esterase
MKLKGNLTSNSLKMRLYLMLMLGVLAVQTVLAGNNPFSRIIVLGDSLSDTGNFFQQSGGIPPAPYAEGRFSNGPLWIEYLAQDLGMEIGAGDNLAVGGATTSDLNIDNGLNGRNYDGLQQQVARLIANANGQLDGDALYTLWIGANDFFVALQTGASPEQLIGNGVANTAGAIQQLWLAGARHFVVPNVPDLGLTPFALQTGLAPVVTQLTVAYNQVLKNALNGLSQAGIDIIQVDAFTTLQTMVGDGDSFGFTNVIQPFLAVGGDPSEFIFWDAVHPTTAGHDVFAHAALVSLLDYYSPSNGKADLPAPVASLNGLVKKSKNH